jgi:hypothetical protein
MQQMTVMDKVDTHPELQESSEVRHAFNMMVVVLPEYYQRNLM